MSHSERKVKWCLKKAKKELISGAKHRGLVEITPNVETAKKHIKKAERNLNAAIDFEKINYSDWSASAAFYSAYHSFMAIISKFGYESRNQECTFALVEYLIETNKINLDIELVHKVHDIDLSKTHETSSILDLRETMQYGVSFSVEDEEFKDMIEIVKQILDQSKEIIES